MKLSLFGPLTYLLALASAQVNRTLTNGWGSTPSDRHYINDTQAQAVIAAAIAKSYEIGVPNNIPVADPSSQLVAFLRMDNAFLASADISIKKAKTVTLFNGLFPSSGIYNRSQPGGDLWSIVETNGGLIAFGGGVPIFDHQGYWIGAVGVSGGSVEQDVMVATAGAEAVGTTGVEMGSS
ncbi:unnamed protein product [Zymoseptoria tritici ST99CH_1A5]|uniref:DUF336-domain-containing protein n=1 Tax=Zymoseptoria tritici ST99CH_1A5 TaxID=1276529 RepID=A0A1Y6L2L8_ZYMTR|nr:unnamed protein product [Zymoseptoria tritici ST99CH_1A5]